MKQNSDNIQEV